MMKIRLSFLPRLACFCACIGLMVSSEAARAQGSLNRESLQRLQDVDRSRLREVPRRRVTKNTSSGRVEMRWGADALNTLATSVIPSNKQECLSKEEVSGQKVEKEVILPIPSSALEIIPGGVFDSYELLKSGGFKYLKWKDRKPYSLSVSSNLIKTKTSNVPSSNPLTNPLQGQAQVTEKAARDAVNVLTRPSNFIGNPVINSEKTYREDTFSDSLGVSIGASFFYLIGSGNTSFDYLSTSKRKILTISSYQPLVAVLADSITSPQDLFKNVDGLNPDALLIKEVQYGRRIYVIAETESNSKEIAQSVQASINGLLGGVALDEDFTKKTFHKLTNVKVITYGGPGGAGGTVTNAASPEMLQQAVADFNAASYETSDIVPLSYKVVDLNGNAISLITNAFLNSERCLRSNKMRISLRNITVVKANDGNNTEELYGNIIINQRDSQGRILAADGKTPQVSVPGAPTLPSAVLTVASKEAPKELQQGTTWEMPATRHVDINVFDLNNRLQILPNIKEEDNVSDDTFTTDDKFNLKLRDMLLEGRTTQVFELRDGGSEVTVEVEITPL